MSNLMNKPNISIAGQFTDTRNGAVVCSRACVPDAAAFATAIAFDVGVSLQLREVVSADNIVFFRDAHTRARTLCSVVRGALGCAIGTTERRFIRYAYDDDLDSRNCLSPQQGL